MEPESSCYAVIFTSRRRQNPDDGYQQAAARMEALAREQPGFLGIESARGDDAVGITISYWDSLEALHAWGRHPEHLATQQRGREEWYASYTLRICRVVSARESDVGT